MPTDPNKPPLMGETVLFVAIAFFGVVFLVNGWMAYRAISTFTGGVEKQDPYQQGLNYNREIAAAAAQQQRHWRVDITPYPTPRARFRDSTGKPVIALDIRGVFSSPATSKDYVFTMREDGPGFYTTSTPAPSGLWDLKLTASRAGEVLFQSSNRVTIP